VCVVKLTDDHGVEHGVKVRAESVYEAALLGLNRLERMGSGERRLDNRECDRGGWEEPTRHVVHVKKLLSWLKAPGKFPPEEERKAKLRVLAK
jgi:hypothetical protein